MWILLLLLGIFLLWILQERLFARYWDKNLTVLTSFSEDHLYEGDTGHLKETITNDKLLPLAALSVRLSLDASLSFLKEAQENSGLSDKIYKRDIFSFLFHQQITRTLPFQAKKRGCYEIDSVDVTAYDFFFREGYYLAFPQKARLYVYPKPVDIRRITLLSQAITGSILSKNRLVADPFEFLGIREYCKEDPMNHINWKASAKSNQLMVNKYDSTTQFSVTILLDIEDPYILKNAALTEESIRIAASLCNLLLKKKMPLRLLSNAINIHEKLPAGAGNMTELLQKFACAKSTELTGPIAELIAHECTHAPSQETYVLISKNHDEQTVSALHALSQTQNTVLWVLPTYDYKMEERFVDEQLHILHWEVIA